MSRTKMTDEEKKAKKREYNKHYRLEHADEIREQRKQYRLENKDKLKEKDRRYRLEHKDEKNDYNKQYYLEHKDERKEYGKRYRLEHADGCKEYNKQYNLEHKDEIREQRKQYFQTKEGRASHLYNAYKCIDRKKGFDVSNNITNDWIVQNVFLGQSCIYCGDSDWAHLGCDRIDNSKPHTPDNCIPCCGICNIEKQNRHSVDEFIEYRKLHPRTLDTAIEKSWEISELPSGIKVIKKKGIIKK